MTGAVLVDSKAAFFRASKPNSKFHSGTTDLDAPFDLVRPETHFILFR